MHIFFTVSTLDFLPILFQAFNVVLGKVQNTRKKRRKKGKVKGDCEEKRTHHSFLRTNILEIYQKFNVTSFSTF